MTEEETAITTMLAAWDKFDRKYKIDLQKNGRFSHQQQVFLDFLRSTGSDPPVRLARSETTFAAICALDDQDGLTSTQLIDAVLDRCLHQDNWLCKIKLNPRKSSIDKNSLTHLVAERYSSTIGVYYERRPLKVSKTRTIPRWEHPPTGPEYRRTTNRYEYTLPSKQVYDQLVLSYSFHLLDQKEVVVTTESVLDEAQPSQHWSNPPKGYNYTYRLLTRARSVQDARFFLDHPKLLELTRKKRGEPIPAERTEFKPYTGGMTVDAMERLNAETQQRIEELRQRGYT